MKRKSICFLLPGWITKSTGGSELQCYLLSEELVLLGWQVEVLTSSDAIKFPQYLNNKIIYKYYTSSKIRLISFFSIFINLLNSRAKFYYVRSNAPILRGAVGLYCKIFQKKYIYALAGNDELNLTILELPPRKNLFKRIITYFDNKITSIFMRYQYSRIDLVICQTKVQFDIMSEKIKTKTVIISNSAKLTNKNWIKKQNIILWIGNFRVVKRPEIFVQLAKDFSTYDFRFIMIGRINGYLNIDYSNTPSNLELLGEQDFDTTSEWMAKSKIIINTSACEGFPNTFIEAWFYKTLVISLSFDIDYMLQKRILGIQCNNNYVVLREHIKQIIKNDSDHSEIINRAKLFVENSNNIKKNVLKLVDYILPL